MNHNLKVFLKKIIPGFVLNFVRNTRIKNRIKRAYKYDFKRYLAYSDSLGSNTSNKLIGNIIKEYHVIEKGLTMPETRLGFGQDLMNRLIYHCLQYINCYGKENQQLQHAVSVILEYEEYHKQNNFLLPTKLLNSITNLKKLFNLDITPSMQVQTNKEAYFAFSNASFPEFSLSRKSVRNYTNEDIPMERLNKALDLARNTPSACNRQCWRTYVFTDKEKIHNILTVQGGNRGFGHLTNKLIVIVADIALFSNDYERNQAYIDGGIYAMNLLYSLHYYQIAACILNCSNSPEKDLQLRALCQIKESEVFIAMLACGIPPENFKIAASPRYELFYTNK